MHPSTQKSKAQLSPVTIGNGVNCVWNGLWWLLKDGERPNGGRRGLEAAVVQSDLTLQNLLRFPLLR